MLEKILFTLQWFCWISESFSRGKVDRNDSLQYPLWFMFNNLHRPHRSIKATTQLVYSFTLHQLKMGFIEIYAVITLSYPWSIQNSLLLALPVNDFLWKLFLCPMAVIFPLHAHPTVHVRSFPIVHSIQIYWPNYFWQFSPGRNAPMDAEEEREENFPNLFTHRWINTFMRIDGHKRKQRPKPPLFMYLTFAMYMHNA